MSAEDLPLDRWADELVKVDGVEGVMLGGSRARGTHTPTSDVDLGLYYRGRPDTDRLRSIAADWCGRSIDVTEPGEWGPWVDGGAWLEIDGIPVDWIYRDLDRVGAAWDACLAGRVSAHHQAGHPFGFVDAAYAGEVALGRILADPGGRLAILKEAAAAYPPALRDAIVRSLWEADFDIAIASKAVGRRDTTYVAGCLFRAAIVCAQVLCADAGSWVLNEKGAVAQAALPRGAGRLRRAGTRIAGRARHDAVVPAARVGRGTSARGRHPLRGRLMRRRRDAVDAGQLALAGRPRRAG